MTKVAKVGCWPLRCTQWWRCRWSPGWGCPAQSSTYQTVSKASVVVSLLSSHRLCLKITFLILTTPPSQTIINLSIVVEGHGKHVEADKHHDDHVELLVGDDPEDNGLRPPLNQTIYKELTSFSGLFKRFQEWKGHQTIPHLSVLLNLMSHL